MPLPLAVSWKVEVQLSVGVWTQIQKDILGADSALIRYGVNGNGPLDRVAGTGEFQFTLRNDARNQGMQQGWYSPSHASKRPGWTFGIPIRASFSCPSMGIVDQVKFRGKVRVIEPDAGRYRTQRVYVTAYDYIRDLAESDAREVAIQVNKYEDDLFDAVLDTLPADSQPVARAFDTGLDLVPYAFDDLGGNTKALSVFRDLAISSVGMFFQKGDGTMTYLNRQTLSTASSSFTFINSMHDLTVPSSQDRTYNRVRSTIHPKQPSATATDVLYTLPSGNMPEIAPGATVEIWTDYTDPNDRQSKVGGIDVFGGTLQPPLVAGTHYTANSVADGSGIDLTASIVASLSAFGSTAKWTVQNTSSTPAFLTLQKVIGKAVRDPGPQTFQAYTSSTLGDRPLNIDLRYQNSPLIGQSVSDYLLLLYGSLTNQIERIEFVASKSDQFMEQALTREPGDVITITETVTGVSSVLAMIQSVEIEVMSAMHMLCRWGLAPGNSTRFWLLGVPGRTELGAVTPPAAVLGF